MTSYPTSPNEKTRGMLYFPRMLDKIRRHARGELDAPYHPNFGRIDRADGACCSFLRVAHDALRERVLTGGTDEEILEWCFEHGRRLNERDIFVWNAFFSKLGWARLHHPESGGSQGGSRHRRSRRHPDRAGANRFRRRTFAGTKTELTPTTSPLRLHAARSKGAPAFRGFEEDEGRGEKEQHREPRLPMQAEQSLNEEHKREHQAKDSSAPIDIFFENGSHRK